jgi:hypothetical protein
MRNVRKIPSGSLIETYSPGFSTWLSHAAEKLLGLALRHLGDPALSVGQESRDRHVAKDVARSAAQREFPKSRAAVASHDQEV